MPGSQKFTLGGTTLFSDTAAPMVTVGWGNLVPRSSKRTSVPFEIGIAFQGSPQTTLNLSGNVCDSSGVNCRSVASDTFSQSQIQSQQTKINNSLLLFKVYPIISIGFGCKF